jgi:GNAT superfamily N-acetyltransferase
MQSLKLCGAEKMISEPIICKIKEDELQQLLDLYVHLHSDDPAPDILKLSRIWQGIISNPALHYIGAEYDGRLVSTCCLVIIPNLTRSGRSYGLIEHVVTHPDYRCMGLGTAVLKYALAIAWEVDCYKVMLLTGSKKPETLRFYEKAGFKADVKTGFIAYPDDQFLRSKK